MRNLSLSASNNLYLPIADIVNTEILICDSNLTGITGSAESSHLFRAIENGFGKTLTLKNMIFNDVTDVLEVSEMNVNIINVRISTSKTYHLFYLLGCQSKIDKL